MPERRDYEKYYGSILSLELLMTEKHKQKIRNGVLNYYNKIGRTGTICKNGYRAMYVLGKRDYEHRIVWENINGKIPKGFTIHHINGNKLDNRIENLELISNKEHSKLHSKSNNFSKSRIGVSPTNKTSIQLIEKIKELRKQGLLLNEICEITKLSYPTVQKYAKEIKYEINND